METLLSSHSIEVGVFGGEWVFLGEMGCFERKMGVFIGKIGYFGRPKVGILGHTFQTL